MLAGNEDAARIAADELESAAARGSIRLRNRDRAYLYLGLGRTDRALSALEQALEERDPSLMWITVDPRVDGLRKDPRFESIIRKLKID